MNKFTGEEAKSLEELIDDLSNEFAGLEIDTSVVELEEGETPEGTYSSEVYFKEGEENYRLKYSIEVDDDGDILYVGVPDVEKLVGKDYVSCQESEVNAERVCEVLRDELNGWV